MAEWQDPKTFAIWLGITLTVVVVLIGSIILFTRTYVLRMIEVKNKLAEEKINYQKALLNDSVVIQERERNRIAAELHDDLISKLNIVLLKFYSQNDSADIGDLLKKGIQIARTISHDLSPPLLQEASLAELIEDFIAPLEDEFEISFRHADFRTENLKEAEKLQLFRIIQEVVSNILKHAKATRIDFQVRTTDKGVSIRIQDNGVGFSPDKKPGGLGLKNIEIRVQLLKGKSRFTSVPQQGTTFLFHYNENAQ